MTKCAASLLALLLSGCAPYRLDPADMGQPLVLRTS